MHLHKGHARIVFDGDVGELPAGTLDRIALVARDAMAGMHDAPPSFLVSMCSNSLGASRS